MNKAEREAARSRCAYATPGPWTASPMPDGVEEELGNVRFQAGDLGRGPGWSAYQNWPCPADASFAAHARADLPAALEDLDAIATIVHGAIHGWHTSDNGREMKAILDVLEGRPCPDDLPAAEFARHKAVGR